MGCPSGVRVVHHVKGCLQRHHDGGISPLACKYPDFIGDRLHLQIRTSDESRWQCSSTSYFETPMLLWPVQLRRCAELLVG